MAQKSDPEFEPSTKPKIVQVIPTMHGGLFCVNDRGEIFERVRDQGDPVNPIAFKWNRVPGPVFE